MKKSKKNTFVDIQDEVPDSVVWELEQTEKEFTESLGKYWDNVKKRTKLQRSVFRTAHKLHAAKKVLRVLGDIPQTVN